MRLVLLFVKNCWKIKLKLTSAKFKIIILIGRHIAVSIVPSFVHFSQKKEQHSNRLLTDTLTTFPRWTNAWPLQDGCGTVGRVTASQTMELQLESNHRQFYFTVNCLEKTEIEKKKKARMGHVKKLATFRQTIALTVNSKPKY